MNPAVADALKVAAICLPVMFGVILFFVFLGQVLLRLFPQKNGS
ncbi:MAG: hypothetical protein QHH02_05515 [Syntrophomonadaceae bacterium]|nr:hypothetical protein [Syntrophomonadaceae bacterium]